jgi:hypothetical protein
MPFSNSTQNAARTKDNDGVDTSDIDEVVTNHPVRIKLSHPQSGHIQSGPFDGKVSDHQGQTRHSMLAATMRPIAQNARERVVQSETVVQVIKGELVLSKEEANLFLDSDVMWSQEHWERRRAEAEVKRLREELRRIKESSDWDSVSQ